MVVEKRSIDQIVVENISYRIFVEKLLSEKMFVEIKVFKWDGSWDDGGRQWQNVCWKKVVEKIW